MARRTASAWLCLTPLGGILIRMATYTTYQTVVMENLVAFDRAVTKLLNEGWQLYGDPYVTPTGHYCQALIK